MYSLSHRGIKLGQVEPIVEVTRNDCLITQVLNGVNCHIERLSLGPKVTLHKIHCSSNRIDEVKRILKYLGLKCRKAGVDSLWVQSSSCSSCAFFASPVAHVLGSRSHGNGRIQYRVLLPSIRELKALEQQMKDAGIEYNITGVVPYVHQELTERQREIMRTALEHGYFDDQSRTSLTELAGIIGMSPSSLSEILRRSLKKAAVFYFDHMP